MVLGLSANSRNVGMVILHRGEILDYKVQFYRQAWSNAKAVHIIKSLDAYRIQHPIRSIALYIPYEHYTTKETAALLKCISAHYKKKAIALTTYEAPSLNSLCETTRAKKKSLMASLAGRYPELRHIRYKELRNKTKYYHKLFEAVGVATLLTQDRASQ